MKTVYSIITSAILLTTSCSDFLDVEPQGQLTQDILFSQEEGALMGINAIYSKLDGGSFVGFPWFSCKTLITCDALTR